MTCQDLKFEGKFLGWHCFLGNFNLLMFRNGLYAGELEDFWEGVRKSFLYRILIIRAV